MIEEVIHDIKRKLLTVDEVEFYVKSIRQSYGYDTYYMQYVPMYRTLNPQGLFEDLAKYRYKYSEIMEFLNDTIFQLIRKHLPEKIREFEKEAEKLGLYVDLKESILVRVPSSEILEKLDELERKLH